MHNNLWFGTEESYFAFQDAQLQLANLLAGGPEAIKAAVISAGGGRGDDPFALPPLWQAQGGVAVLDISGSLIDGHAGFMRLFGAIGYSDIQDALAEIAADKSVRVVVQNIDSGGGQVNGLADAGDALRALDTVKPVMTYASGTMGSAAYWMGASARYVTAAATSQVGSVGTLIVHTERSKQRADAGLKDTIVRYGKYKALGNPLEPLSEDGKAQLQALADEAGEIFVDYVAGRRGMSAKEFQAKAGEGRVFMGRQGKEVGLLDAVMQLTDAIAYAKTLDKVSAQQHNPGNSRKGLKMKLSKKSILAIAAGTALDQLGLHEPEANLEGVKLEGDALTVAETEAKEVIAAVEARIETAVTAAKEVVSAESKAALDAATAAASATLKTVTDKVALAESAALDLKSKLDGLTEVAAAYAGIVKASMSVMSIALGGSADVGASLTGAELTAEHERLAEQFKAKFPSGGVAATMGAPKTPQPAPMVNPMFAHLVKPISA